MKGVKMSMFFIINYLSARAIRYIQLGLEYCSFESVGGYVPAQQARKNEIFSVNLRPRNNRIRKR